MLKNLLPLKTYVDVSSSGISQRSATGGAAAYTIGELPTAHAWVKIPGLTKTITLQSARNNVTIVTEGMVQMNNTTNTSRVESQTFSVGIFVDGKLFSVRQYYIDGFGGSTCLSQTFNIKTNVQNLSIGTHTIDVYAITRAQQSGTASSLTWAQPATGCTNINTSPMAEGVMTIQLMEL